MDSDVKKLLKKNIRIAESNHKILTSMQRHQRIASALKFIYWIVIIIVIFGGYIYIMKPLVGQLNNVYSGLTGTVNTVQDATQSVTDVGGDVSSFLGNLFNKNKE